MDPGTAGDRLGARPEAGVRSGDRCEDRNAAHRCSGALDHTLRRADLAARRPFGFRQGRSTADRYDAEQMRLLDSERDRESYSHFFSPPRACRQ